MNNQARVAIAVGAVAVIVLAFVLANGSSDSDKSPTTATVSATEPTGGVTADTTATAPAAEPVETIVVKNGEPVGGVKTLNFSNGDQIKFNVESDIAEEIHVHGYDIAKDVAAGGSVSFSFDATIEGIFEVELEHAGVQIASLKVSP